MNPDRIAAIACALFFLACLAGVLWDAHRAPELARWTPPEDDS